MHLSSIIIVAVFFTESIQMSVSETIPCPGHDNPQNFMSIPLTDRPNLAKILQHGWDPNLITLAVSPMKVTNLTTLTETPPMVKFHDGFVGRPFRTISHDACQWQNMHVVDQLECVRDGSSSFQTDKIPSVLKQFRFQMMGIYDIAGHPQVPALFHDAEEENKNASFVEWGDAVQEFLDCNKGGVAIKYQEQFTCVVNLADCRTFDPEFLEDLSNLPITVTPSSTSTKTTSTYPLEDVNREMYQKFVDKWGYGSVNRFQLGARETILYPILDDPQQQDTTFLHLGRTGGSGKDFTSEYIYTPEECLDPSPARLLLEPWDEVLEKLFRYDNYFPNKNSTSYNVTKEIVDKMDALVSNFYELRSDYPFFFQHFNNFKNLYLPPEECEATTTPSESPSTANPTASPTETTSASPTETTTAVVSKSDSINKNDSAAVAILGGGPKFWVICNCFTGFLTLSLLAFS